MIHKVAAQPSAAGWQAACPCGWVSDHWYRAKNTAERDAREHVRSALAKAGTTSRRQIPRHNPQETP